MELYMYICGTMLTPMANVYTNHSEFIKHMYNTNQLKYIIILLEIHQTIKH